MPTTELMIGTVSTNPYWNIAGFVINATASDLCGAVQISTNGNIYLRMSGSVVANRDILVTAVGTYY